MRLGRYINEGRSRPVDDGWALDFLEKNCLDSLSQKWVIYRGVEVDKNSFMYVDPYSLGERVSPHAMNNLYNLILSNAPSWSKYPKRNKSLICSVSATTAIHYGDAFYVFPVDRSKVGVCPDFDIWGSFKNITELDDLNYGLSELFDTIGLGLPKTWNEIKQAFKEIDKNKEKVKDVLADRNNTLAIKMFSRNIDYFWKDTTLMEAIEEALDPESNGFKLVTVGDENISKTSSVEVWTDGVSILVPVHKKFWKIMKEKFNIELRGV